MSGTGDGKNDGSGRPPYYQYQYDLYAKAILLGQYPSVTTDPNKLEEQARKSMTKEGFNYVYGGAGESSTTQANRLAFRQWRIIPRFLRPTMPRDLRVDLFGKIYDCPLFMAPVGVQSAYHKDAESGVAAACAELGVPFIFSTASSTALEDVATAADAALATSLAEEWGQASSGTDAMAQRWFQLYWPESDDLTASLLSRARAAGCTALVVTLDTFTLAWRPLDLDAGYLPFATGEGNALGFSDPVFRRRFAADTDGDTPENNPVGASRAWTSEVFSGRARDWAELALLRRLWGPHNPILLKGVLSAADARKARASGLVDGIIVSNHGGRQLDGAIPALEALPEIVDAVADEGAVSGTTGGSADFPVLFDSGVRTGADVMKALALGAGAVLIGRPVIYGLGIAGRDGARQVLAGLLADLDQSMGLAGVQNVRQLKRDMLKKIPYCGDVKSQL
ncbi:hypothetical protein VTK73DRAFT_7620 [Phialemonium thermophilum]|uniref:FMN hydroxy acid dehydrogenase domain-containing protein n=1 Tax=Phialemonium thermophilum TaxID=223376 RepID=A0ABR3Y6B8_9PEZI